MELFESQITIIEENWVKKENDIKELLKKNEADERNSLKKGNILKRIENLEKLNDEKDQTIKFLVDKVNTLENKSKEVLENVDSSDINTSELFKCEYCDFSSKSERRFKLHLKEKHEITKIEINVFCRANEKYLNSDRDSYRSEIESEIDVLEDVIEMNIDSSKMYDYVGRFLPTKIVLRTRIPEKWQTNESFRKQIWDRINKRIPKGKISEDKDGKD